MRCWPCARFRVRFCEGPVCCPRHRKNNGGKGESAQLSSNRPVLLIFYLTAFQNTSTTTETTAEYEVVRNAG